MYAMLIVDLNSFLPSDLSDSQDEKSYRSRKSSRGFRTLKQKLSQEEAYIKDMKRFLSDQSNLHYEVVLTT
jgi:hypothetical protein